MRTEIFRALNASVATEGRPVLKGLNISLSRGETLGVFGTFDSGNTSLLDMITGKTALQSGVLYYNDTPFISGGMNQPGARVAHISKDSALVNGLKLWENILVIRKYRRKKIFLSKNLIFKEMTKCFANFDLDFSPNQLTDTLTPVQHIIIEILKAHLLNVQIILISDFSLECTKKEYDELFAFIDKLKKKDISFIVTSYRISNLKMLADRISFLTGGSIIKSVENKPNKNGELVDRILTSIFPDNMEPKSNKPVKNEVIFQAKNIDIGLAKPASFDLRKGEIAALVDPFKSANSILESKIRSNDKTSTFLLRGKPIRKFGWKENVAFIDFNTKDMIFTSLSIANNICFANYIKYSFIGIIRHRLMKFISEEFVSWYGDDSLDDKLISGNISEKQRIAILLFRLRLANPDVLFCLDPGIDSDYINNKMIHRELADLAYKKGMAVCILVSNKDNVNNFADRYIVVTKDNILEEEGYRSISKDNPDADNKQAHSRFEGEIE